MLLSNITKTAVRQLGRRAANPLARRSARAFTLVEILIVVVIIGILAAIVVPQFSNASQSARENTLKDELRYLRTQIVVYKAQHQDVPPGYPSGNPGATPAQAALLDQMSKFSDLRGNVNVTASAQFAYGPYLSQFPTNPVNSLNTFMMVGNGQPMPQPDGSTGWIYKPQTQELIANVRGMDDSGIAFSSY